MSTLRVELTERLDSLSSKLSSTESRLKALEEQQMECEMLKATVSQLQTQINLQAQTALVNELEISGLDETPNENPYHLVLVAASTIGVEVTDLDLDNVFRAGPRRSNTGSGPSMPRPLVARFTRKAKRDEFMKASKARRNLDNKTIVGSGPERRIFVNERLTSENRRLFRDSRVRARESGFKFCWTRNGSIYIRKRDRSEKGETSPAIHITSDEVLYRLVNPSTNFEGNKNV